jgi:hypothetical protein
MSQRCQSRVYIVLAVAMLGGGLTNSAGSKSTRPFASGGGGV